MVESLLVALSASLIILTVILLWGKSKERIGRISAEKLSLEEKSERISRGVEKLMGPRPTRRVLVEHWERRLRKATGGDPDTPLPDSKLRDD